MNQPSLEKVRATHEILTDFHYDLQPVSKGYANRTLHIDLTNGKVTSKPVTQHMKDVFTGGRGFCLWLLWNAVPDHVKWDDPENELVISGGPIGGITAYPGSGKLTAVTVSPLTDIVIDSNGGGYFGPYLKFAGWDALEIQGKAEKDVVIFIDGDEGSVRIEEAPFDPVNTHLVNTLLTDLYAADEKEKKGISVISAGQAAEYSPMSGLNISYYDNRRKEVRVKQAARGGCGRVLRDKKVKAIVVRFTGIKGDNNGCADFELVRKAGKRINKEIADLDDVQNDMRHLGTTNLVNVINHTDLLPVENYRYGKDPRAVELGADYWKKVFDYTAPDSCWLGCTLACSHGTPDFELMTGPYKGQKVTIDGPDYETIAGLGSNIGVFDPRIVQEINFYCDTYGIDTISLGTSMAFAYECYEYGILNKEITGGLELIWGNGDAALELVHQIARGEDFGITIGQGIRKMKKLFAEKYGADKQLLQDIGMEVKGLEVSEYLTKESLAQQGGYAMANKGPQHDEAWLIFMDMVLKQIPTFEDKAEALHFFPMWRTWFSLHGLCKLPWNDITPTDNKDTAEPAKVPQHIENYIWLYEGVTGNKATIEDLILHSERVYNFQRLFNLRLSHGKRNEDYPPYRAMGPVTVKEYESRADRYDKQLTELLGINPGAMSVQEKIEALRKYRMDQYDKLMDAVYARRGWTKDGIPTLETARRLGIDFPDIVKLIENNVDD